jgi:hypothetical protein
MRFVKGGATARKTDIGGLVESFLDEFSDSISPSLWDELESLAADVDEAVLELEKQIDKLEAKE